MKTTWKYNLDEKLSLIEKLFYSFGHVNILLLKEIGAVLCDISCLTVEN